MTNNEKELVESLKQIKNLFEEHSIEYWLDTGTLLGAVREKKFIEWDYDVDIGTWTDNLLQITNIFDKIRKLGFEICYFQYEQCIKILREKSEVDINLYHLENNKATRKWYVHNSLGQKLDYIRWLLILDNISLKKSQAPPILTKTLVKIRRIISKNLRKKLANTVAIIYQKLGCNWVKIDIPNHFFTDLSTINFYDMQLKAPKKTEEYLEYRYGTDWRVPKKEYKFHRDDQSIVNDQ
jgi:phosphorylcholine metabolism protein LicD